MTRDSAPEKWIYREHTRVKHDILRKYLSPWLTILGRYHPRLCYFDGFAGRGEYEDGSLGSPLIAMEIAEQLVRQKKVEEVVPIFIDENPDNFANLRVVIEANKSRFPNVREPILECDEFSSVISQVIEKVGSKLAPSFFFIDPFGFTGVPFAIVKDILSIPRTEIFFTFMVRDINRFLTIKDLWHAFDELFGTDKWRSFMNDADRENSLREFYISRLREETDAKYVWSFRVCADERIQTTYFLIHATRRFEGLRIMKEIMYHEGAGGTFAYLGPDDCTVRAQMKLFDENIPSLKGFLLERFKGRTLTYDEVLEESYMETPLIDKHYREAIKALEKERKVSIKRVSSKTERGLRDDDEITFLG